MHGTKLGPLPKPEVRSRILLVEDDPYVAKFIRKRLIIEGFEVRQMSNGMEALNELRNGYRPDLILTDLRMPNMDGHQLLEVLSEIDALASIPVIVLSGSATVSERVKCLENGASDYLCKPIDGQELAARVRVHLRNTQELRRLRKEARFDTLTQVLNRRGVLEALQKESKRSHRSGSPLTIMLVDADKFKEINDNYGHAAGDVVLMEIASTLKECLRMTDVIGRLGGDEFVIALPSVDEPLATEIKHRLRQRVAANLVPGSAKKVSISIGLAVDTDGTASLDELFEAADKAMYSDKRRRRNTLTPLSVVGSEARALGSQP